MNYSKISKILLIIALCSCLFVPKEVQADDGVIVAVEVYYDYQAAYDVLNYVNQYRSQARLSTLIMDRALLEVAMLRAAEGLLSFSHTRPDGSSCFSAFPNGNASGENIAMGYGSPEAVMNGWMNSQGHRDNILSSSYNLIGIGCVVVNGYYSWVQCFQNRSDYETTSREYYDNKNDYAYLSFYPSDYNATFSILNKRLNVGDETYVKCELSGVAGSLSGKLISLTSSDNSICSIEGSTIKAHKSGKVTLTSSSGDKFEVVIGRVGVLLDENGKYAYYDNDVLDASFTGLARNYENDKWYYMVDGYYDKSMTGLVKNPKNDKWFYVEEGIVDWNFSGLAQNPNNKKWFYVTKGAVDWGYNGVGKLGKRNLQVYITDGAFNNQADGLVTDTNGQYGGKTVLVKQGIFISNYNGIYKGEDGNFYYLENGIVNTAYNGTYKGKRVENGIIKP